MNLEDFKALIQKYKLGQDEFKKPTAWELWEEAEERIEPHVEGEMPEAIRKAFPNEMPKQYEYREKTYRSNTKPKLGQAMANVKRVVMQGNFTIVWGSEMSDHLKVQRFEGFDFLSFFFNVVYPFRVKDPNGLIAIVPLEVEFEGEFAPPEFLNKTKPYTLELFESDQIRVFTKDLIVVEKEKGDKQTKYYVFERGTFTIVNVPKSLGLKGEEENIKLFSYTYAIEPLPDQQGELYCYVLGGMPEYLEDAEEDEPKIYYVSDFDYAVPAMDDLAVKASQFMSSYLTLCFPLRVTRDLECTECEGKKEVAKRNKDGSLCYTVHFDEITKEEYKTQEMIICGSCKGAGTTHIGQLDNINVPRDYDSFGKDKNTDLGDISKSVVGFAVPPTDIFRLQSEEVEKADIKCDTILNITKESVQSQSGTSKEKDREGLYTQLKGIAESMSNLIKRIGNGIIDLRFINQTTNEQEKTAFLVQTNDDFSLKSPEEAQAIALQNYDKKQILTRQMEYIDTIKAQYKSDLNAIQAAVLAFNYTNGNCRRTLDELKTYTSLNVMSETDVIKAINCESIFYRLLNIGTPIEDLNTQVDAEIAKLLPPPPLPTVA